MKKLFPIMLALCLLAQLTGCGASSATPSNAVEMPLVPLTPAEEITYEVVTDRYEESVYSDSGETLLMTISFTLPRLQAYADGQLIETPVTSVQENALERVTAFNEKFDQWKNAQATEQYIADAKDWYGIAPEVFTGDNSAYFGEEFTFTVYRTGSLISVAAVYYSYLGGAHPNTVYLSWNFDLDSGTFLTIPELATDPQAFTLAVADMIEAQAAEQFQNAPDFGSLPLSDIYWTDYRETLEKWGSDYAASFDADGLTVIFSAYELAPYAAGAQEFHFPYTALESYWSSSGRTVLGRN